MLRFIVVLHFLLVSFLALLVRGRHLGWVNLERAYIPRIEGVNLNRGLLLTARSCELSRCLNLRVLNVLEASRLVRLRRYTTWGEICFSASAISCLFYTLASFGSMHCVSTQRGTPALDEIPWDGLLFHNASICSRPHGAFRLALPLFLLGYFQFLNKLFSCQILLLSSSLVRLGRATRVNRCHLHIVFNLFTLLIEFHIQILR